MWRGSGIDQGHLHFDKKAMRVLFNLRTILFTFGVILARGHCADSPSSDFTKEIWKSTPLAFAALNAIAHSYRDLTGYSNDSKFGYRCPAFKTIADIQAKKPVGYRFEETVKKPSTHEQSLFELCYLIVSELDDSIVAYLHPNSGNELARCALRSYLSFKIVDNANFPLSEESVKRPDYKMSAIVLFDEMDGYSVALLQSHGWQRKTQQREEPFDMKEYLRTPSFQAVVRPVLICYSLLDESQSVNLKSRSLKLGKSPEELKEWCEKIKKYIYKVKERRSAKVMMESRKLQGELLQMKSGNADTPQARSALEDRFSAQTLKWGSSLNDLTNLCKEFETLDKDNNRNEKALQDFSSRLSEFEFKHDLQKL